MFSPALIQDKIFILLSDFFQIEPTDFYLVNDLAYEDSEEELINRLNYQINNKTNAALSQIYSMVNNLMIIIDSLIFAKQPLILALDMAMFSEDDFLTGTRTIRNYGGFYTGKDFKTESVDENPLGINEFFRKLLDLFSINSKPNTKKITKEIHRAGKMYRGHSLD